MSDKLKPCPFCGGEPFITDIESHTHESGLAAFMPDHSGSSCVECGCGVGFVDEDREAATKRWNTRAALAQPQNDAEAVAWRYRYELKEGSWGTWTVQKNKPNWFEPTMTDVQVESLYTAPPSPERMREALEKARGAILSALEREEDHPRWWVKEAREALRAGGNHRHEALNNAEHSEARAETAERRVAELEKQIVDLEAKNDALMEYDDDLTRNFDAVGDLHKEVARIERERDELQQVFDSRWEADQRAIKAWQAAHPDRSITWPDHADMVVWLLSARDEARAALKPFALAANRYDAGFADNSPTWGDYGLTLGHLRAARAVIEQGE